MDLLRRHWEKILLTISLLALLAAAVLLLLKIGALREEVQGLPKRFRRGSELAALNVKPYESAIDRLTNPVVWAEMPVDPFKEIIQDEVTLSPTNGPSIPQPPTTITLLRVDQVPFTMMFVAYIGQGRNFQLNLQFRPRTFFIEKVHDAVKDQTGDTGYVVTQFTNRFTKVKDPNFGDVERTVDVSELTLQHPGEKPIVLVLGKPAVWGEPVATVQCDRRGYNSTSTQVRRGQRFRCGQTIYNVVDIKPEEMLIIDEQKPEEKPVAIKLKSAMPVNEEEGVPGGLGESGNQNQ